MSLNEYIFTCETLVFQISVISVVFKGVVLFDIFIFCIYIFNFTLYYY